MSQKESSRISLTNLRGKPTSQSVSNISFRFDSSSNDIVEIADLDDSINDSANPRPSDLSASQGNSPSNEQTGLNKFLQHRSTSLDSPSGSSPDVSFTLKPDAHSIFSKIKGTFEEKLNEIRSEKYKDKDFKSAFAAFKEPLKGSFDEQNEEHRGEFLTSKNSEVEFREKIEGTPGPSPSRIKTTIAQDIAEQTNKIKSEYNKNIKTKFTELRNRKNSRENLNQKRNSSLFTSLVSRDEGIATEDLLKQCEDIDHAIEVEEDTISFYNPLNKSLQIQNTENFDDSNSKVEENALDSVNECLCGCKHTSAIKEPSLSIKDVIINSIQNFEFFKGKSSIHWIIGIFILCFAIPLPRFIAGFIFGIVLTMVISIGIFKLVLPNEIHTVSKSNTPLFMDLPMYGDHELHKGWLNELDIEYQPETYNVSLTHSVWVRLQGSILQIDNARKRIFKHARSKEELHSGGFVNHREYDLSNCEVILLPRNLPRKWLWSRKYPICIRLKPDCFPCSASSSECNTARETPSNSLSLDLDGDSSEPSISLENESKRFNNTLDIDSYEEITKEMCTETNLILFARTDREKDDWYRHFVKACQLKQSGNIDDVTESSSISDEARSPTDTDTMEENLEIKEEVKDMGSTVEEKQEIDNEDKDKNVNLSFEQYMAQILHPETSPNPSVNWFNSIVGRILFDFLQNQYWSNKVQERVQRKLSKLRLPYFVGEILVTGIELGNSIPLLKSAGEPTIDPRGIWIDFEVEYSGGFMMILETKLDLMKLKERQAGSNIPSPNDPISIPLSKATSSTSKQSTFTHSASSECVLRNLPFDTDTDDSIESSSDEELEEVEGVDRIVGSGGAASRKLVKFVNTVAASKYFKSATEWSVLHRAMQGVSNTRIELSVEVKCLNGVLALNVPPLPADRIWYGFREFPKLVMVAKPRLGERILNVRFLAEFIQKQLRVIFEKVFVLPNMDDLVIPIMSPLLPGQINPPRLPWEIQSQTDFSPVKSPSKDVKSVFSSKPFEN